MIKIHCWSFVFTKLEERSPAAAKCGSRFSDFCHEDIEDVSSER